MLFYTNRSDSVSNLADKKKEHAKRIETFSKVYKAYLKKLHIPCSKKILEIHFDLINNKFIKRSKNNIKEVDDYLSLILKQNKKYLVFKQKSLKKILLKKFISFFIIKFKLSNFILIFFSSFIKSLVSK